MAKKILKYDRNVSRALNRAAKTTANRYHIISSEGSWKVRLDGKIKSERIYVSKDSAVKYARNAFVNGTVKEYVIHGIDGSIEEWKTKK